MQVEYKKEWMDTFLWVLPENRAEESYEEKMNKYNPGGGRLEFFRQEKEGEEYFCYKVTGKKALNSVYAVLPIGEHQVRTILGQLFTALEDGREYLLAEEDFVLSPNFIFATFPQMTLEFCYLPGYGVPLRRQLEGLFEYLLNRVDYEDKQAVNLLYDCYMFCMKEKGGLTEIKRLLEKEDTGKKQEAIPMEPPRQVVYREAEEEDKKQQGGTYVSWLAGKLFPWKRREPALVAEKSENYRAEKTQDTANTEKPVLLETEMPEASDRTVLLFAGKKKEEPELVCEQTGEVIPLTKFPFYLGSAKEYADYVLLGEGVSRIHCCISKKENNFYLSDLNSTNGTYLNGKEVFAGKEMLLSANDEIRICSQEFYIKFPCH